MIMDSNGDNCDDDDDGDEEEGEDDDGDEDDDDEEEEGDLNQDNTLISSVWSAPS